MRETKFRVWDKKNKRFVNFTKIVFSIRKSVFLKDGFGNNIDGNFEVQQYTGLKDKKGNDIYEGDIVDSGQSVGSPNTALKNRIKITGEVFFEKGKFMFGNPKSKYKKWLIDFLPFEIIGNKFENPELLEDK